MANVTVKALYNWRNKCNKNRTYPIHLRISIDQERTYLTIEEIKLWLQVQFTEAGKHLERTRDFYLFQIYTGFYYKDVKYFKREYLVKDHEYG